MMDPKMMRGFIDSLSGMSDDQVSMMMKSMGKHLINKYIKKIWFLTYAKYLKYYVQLNS